MEKIRNFTTKNRYMTMLLGLMVAMLLLFSLTKGTAFLNLGTLNSISMQFPEFGLMTLGVMFCFIIGDIDMSFVALGDFASVMAVMYMGSHLPEEPTTGQQLGVILVGLLIAIVVGAFGGLVNGVLIAYLNIPPVMATIAMQLVWLGLSTAITQGYAVTGVPPLYTEIGHASVGFIPVPTFIFIIFFIICAVLLKYTTYGEKLYMIGTNVKAARFSGINTKGMIIGTFILADIIASLGCMIMVSTMNSAKADYGTSYVMTVILILVLAGVSPNGGVGKIFNVLLAVVAIQIISTGVNLYSFMNSYWANFIWGAMLVVVLVLSTKLVDGVPSAKPAKKKEPKKD